MPHNVQRERRLQPEPVKQRPTLTTCPDGCKCNDPIADANVVSAPGSLLGADEVAMPKHPQSDQDCWDPRFEMDGISEETIRAIWGDDATLDDHGGIVMPLEDEEEDDEVHVAPTQSVIKVAIDSGAADHVINPLDVPCHAVKPSAGSRAGKHFLAAGGHRIPNEGQLNLVVTGEGFSGKVKSMFQAAAVTRPLLSVSKICDSGCKVLFDDQRAIIRKGGKNVGTFVRRGGLYVAELVVKDPERPADFPRQGADQ